MSNFWIFVMVGAAVLVVCTLAFVRGALQDFEADGPSTQTGR